MRVRLLGPVEFFSGEGAAMPIAAPKRRAVLAVLALELNRVVPVERVVELVWDGDPPPRARTALQGHVSALRRLLAEGDPRADGGAPGLALVTRHPGYVLLGDRQDVDLHAFHALCAQAADADDRIAVKLLGQALDLWQGAPLADLTSTSLRDGIAVRLVRARLSALEGWAERSVRLGRGPETLAALEAAVREQPFREPLVRLLLLALHQADRQAEAIELFHRTRELLADELGIDPGPPLRAAYESVLRAGPPARGSRPDPDPPAPPGGRHPAGRHLRPAQLPSEGAGFIGRSVELGALDKACGADGRTAPGLALVAGPAGVGKTALALRWAHRHAAGFADGQLFADLRGFSAAPPVSAGAVLSGFLRALGIRDADMPNAPDDRAALYRGLLAERRVLVVLDNVRSVADVLPLLPSGPGSAAVVTSRTLLGGLVVRQGAAVVRLEVLPADESRELLAAAVGGDRVAAEVEATRELARLCDGLPLALRVAGARLATHPGWTVADLVEQLSDEQARLASLTTDDADLGVEAALHLSYLALPEAAAELFRLLGLHPGPDVDRWTAAALADRPPADTRRALLALASAHLLQETTPGRFARHDLVRLYTVQLAERSLGAAEREAATGRLLDYYLDATAAAAEPVSSQKHLLYRTDAGPVAGIPPVSASVAASALWFRTEAAAMRALVDAFAEGPRADRAWRLACNTMPLYFGTEHVDDWVAASLAGLRAAEADGDLSGRSRMHADVGMALDERGEHGPAMCHLQRSVRLARESGSRETHYLALFRLGIGYLGTGALEQARETMEAGLLEADELGDPASRAQTLNNLGHVLNLLGRHREALDCAARARSLTAASPSSHTHLASLATCAEAQQALGRTEEAIGLAREALRNSREYGNPVYEAQALHLIGQFQRDLGRPAEAAQALRQSLDILAPLGRPEADAVHALLGVDGVGSDPAVSP
ncbi:AfsR/SARP family transcriptional regulator [Streptacidiphilus carbonis]|uniref:AfsR/SARP family transcriptional regulator n=1 Tax=Streptacidiphilus carbonis TaxID=105422 RepID=UPI000694B805|nr:BTAD domain-containing putative transcriptional regulator [Streptacidiphilus carbonis]